MTRVLHTSRISNVEIIKCVVNNKDGKFLSSVINNEDDLFSTMKWARFPSGLGIFLCPMLLSLLKKDHHHYLLPSLKFTIFIIYLTNVVLNSIDYPSLILCPSLRIE